MRWFDCLKIHWHDILSDVFFFLLLTYIQDQSMARVNLNNSEELVTNTTPASKYTPKRSRICINRNPSFQTSLHKIFKKSFYEVNITSQQSLEVILVWKGEFQLIHILGLLGMYFDAVVVFVTNSSLLFRLAVAIL